MDRMDLRRAPGGAKLWWWQAAGASLAILAGAGESAWGAGPPNAQFDVQPLVECRDVTPAEFRRTNPGEKLVEARLAISVLDPPDASIELNELLVRVESPDRTAAVHDYAPRTTLQGQINGTIRIDRQEESNKSLDFRLKAGYPGIADADVKGSSNARSSSNTHFEQLPPLELGVASGTVNRGFGAYFKWKPSARTTLEGAHEVVLVLRVPQSWQGDWLAVHCEAFGREPAMITHFAEPQRSAKRSFVVALYELGSDASRAAATRLLRAESDLRRQMAADRKQVERQLQPTPWRELGGLLSGRDTTAPSEWWEQVLYGPAAGVDRRATERLPSTVRDAVQRYHQCRRELRGGRVATNATARVERLPPP